jgi:hypothetical protein
VRTVPTCLVEQADSGELRSLNAVVAYIKRWGNRYAAILVAGGGAAMTQEFNKLYPVDRLERR